ncbi:MAG TPA: TerC family protein [Burkholderiales bacterium]|nr:TerC family protein [Burkholderiales bacterium]
MRFSARAGAGRLRRVTAEFLSALAAIVLIDLVLAGDNAIVIALAARNLPRAQQRKAVIWGTVGAIAVRSSLTVAVLWLLQIPGLMLGGGVLLAWIGYRLLVDNDGGGEHEPAPAAGFWSAMRTIVIADTVMGLDNVLAVAGAAGGSILLVVLGLLISIPIVVWGSTLILRWIERFPAILYAGGAVLAWTAAKMIAGEPFMAEALAARPGWTASIYVGVIGGVLAAALLRNRRVEPTKNSMETSS